MQYHRVELALVFDLGSAQKMREKTKQLSRHVSDYIFVADIRHLSVVSGEADDEEHRDFPQNETFSVNL